MLENLAPLLSPYAQSILTPDHKVFEPVSCEVTFNNVTRTGYIIATECPNEHWKQADTCQPAAGMCQLSVEFTPNGHRINLGWL